MRRGVSHRVHLVTWPLAGLTVLVLVTALVLLGLDRSQTGMYRIGIYGIGAVAVIAYAGTGRLIASRVPRNAIGWLLCLVGLSLAVTMLTEQYALRGLVAAPGSLPAAHLAGWLSQVTFVLTFAPMFFLILLFPDGRLPSRRWRPVLWLMFAFTAGWEAQNLQAGTTIVGGFSNILVAQQAIYPNPLGLLPRHGWFSGLLLVTFFLGLAMVVLVVASVFARRRAAGAELRKQLAWLGYAGTLIVVSAAVFFVFAVITHGRVESLVGDLLWVFLMVGPAIGIPLACMVAVLKYRLYEIDRIISRTLAYAIVTVLLVSVYAGLVLLTTRVLTVNSPVAVAASTLAAAALFSPLLVWVQRMVDRRFNRAHYDADKMVTAFAARLQDAVDLDSVRDDLAGVVEKALEPAHVSVWISERR